jgi:hypothetical protein
MRTLLAAALFIFLAFSLLACSLGSRSMGISGSRRLQTRAMNHSGFDRIDAGSATLSGVATRLRLDQSGAATCDLGPFSVNPARLSLSGGSHARGPVLSPPASLQVSSGQAESLEDR